MRVTQTFERSEEGHARLVGEGNRNPGCRRTHPTDKGKYPLFLNQPLGGVDLIIGFVTVVQGQE